MLIHSQLSIFECTKLIMMKNFALIGAAGYIAPRHLKAIKDTGNFLSAAYDPHDSVGILDSFFYEADFFTNYERFERHIFKMNQQSNTRLHFLTVCSPNYLHDTHVRLGLQNECDVICEKPIVLTYKNLDLLENLQKETSKKVFTIMQLRYHPELLKLKKELETTPGNRKKIELTYITPRGKWYFNSWKGDVEKSGGIATNIGIHLFDLLIWLFGSADGFEINISERNKMSGKLILENADVSWFLSLDKNDLDKLNKPVKVSLRKLEIDGKEIEFSDGFTDLHSTVYREILAGNGMGITDARASIELVEKIRHAELNKFYSTR